MRELTLAEKFEYEYLGLDPERAKIVDPFANRGRKDVEEPHLHVLRLMRDPKYAFFTCKALMNGPSGKPLELLPFQCVILRELWYRPFPMLIASRGASKCTDAETMVVTDAGFARLGDVVGDCEPGVPRYVDGLRLLGESGFNEVSYCWNNGVGPIKEITTRMGYSVRVTPNHPLRVVRGGEVCWVEADDIVPGDMVPIDRSERWPSRANDLDAGAAYLFGLLVGDGCYTLTRANWIGFTTADQELGDAVVRESSRLWGKAFTKSKQKYQYDLYSKRIKDSLFQQFGFSGTLAGDKDVPKSVLGASRESVAAFIRGLMDTDGCAVKTHAGITFSSKSPRLVRSLQFLLLRFGVVSRTIRRLNKKYDRYYHYLYISGDNARVFARRIGFGLGRKQAILSSKCDSPTNANIDVIPSSIVRDDALALRDRWADVRPSEARGYSYRRQVMSRYRVKAYDLTYEQLGRMLDLTESISYAEEWRRLDEVRSRHYFYDRVQSVGDDRAITYDVHMKSDEDRSFITNGLVSHNSFLMAVYALLRALLIPGRKIVITGSGFRQAKTVFMYAETIWHNSPLLRDMVSENANSGPHHDADRWRLQLGDSTITALPIGSGEKIRGERAHDILSDEFSCLCPSTLIDTPGGLRRLGDTIGEKGLRVYDGRGDEGVVQEYIRTPPTTAYRVRTRGNYEFTCSGIHRIGTQEGWKLGKDLQKGDLLECPRPSPWPEHPIDGVDVNAGWLLGILLAEGSVNPESQISVHMTDRECIGRIRQSMIDFDPTVDPHIYHREASWDDRGWRNKETWICFIARRHFREKLAELGLARTTAHDKKVPWSILQSPRPVMVAFLAGLFEGDGSAFLWSDIRAENKFGVAYYSVSEVLCREVQVVLRKLGYFCTRQRRRSKLSDKWQWMLRLNGTHALRLAEELNIPKWRPLLEIADRKHTFGRYQHVTFIDRLDKWQAISLVNGRKKRTYHPTREEAVNVVLATREHQPDYLPVKSVEELPEPTVLYDYRVPPQHSFVGNGFLQHNSIDWEIFETVIRGFGVVELEPGQKVRRQAKIRVLRREGMWSDEMQEEERHRTIGNQTIICGTGSYQFNHFYAYWKRWKAIVESKGDPKKLEMAFPGGVSEKLDWRDYSIIRIPVDLLPEGFMDEKQVANSRATQNTSIFLNEFGACVHPDEPVITDRGVKPMADIEIGDKVLTHRGRFRAVTGVTSRLSPGQIVQYRTLGYGRDVRVTAEHPFWQGGDGWAPLGDETRLANLSELGGAREIDIRPIVRDYLETEGGDIYARAGNTKLARYQINWIRGHDGPMPALAAEMRLPISTVYRVRYAKRGGVHAIPPSLPLDRNFGLVVGYYAAGGSIISSGRAVGFALDGHVGMHLEGYLTQLIEAIESVFGLSPKVYHTSDHVANVVITNTLATDLMSWVCPGLCDTKWVRPEVIWSNEAFLRGFLEGYWNGDGHPPENRRTTPLATTNSPSLAAQVKVAFSYLGITATIGYLPERPATIRGMSYTAAPGYAIKLTGEHGRRFRHIIYGQDIPAGGRRGRIINDGDVSLMPVVRKEIVPYAGTVYNLHVEEDESYSLLNATVHNCFATDSQGFFKRSLIETCVTQQPIPVDGEPVQFRAVTRGNPDGHYIYGIDPASEADRFSIVILEVYPTHRRIVHCWTTTRQQHKARIQAGTTKVADFYGFCGRRIRELMKVFPCEHIAMDSQGGGVAVAEALHDPDKLERGERVLWPITADHPLSDGKERDTDNYEGLHILEMVNFSRADWVADANHGLRKDMEDRVLLFPEYDPGVLAIAMEDDFRQKRTCDTLEDAAAEIEEIKEELASIVHAQVGTSLRDRWDTPEVKLAGSRKGRLRKDRYSALLMANASARRLNRQHEEAGHVPLGGFVHASAYAAPPTSSRMYLAAPDWFLDQVGDQKAFEWAIRRNGVSH